MKKRNANEKTSGWEGITEGEGRRNGEEEIREKA